MGEKRVKKSREPGVNTKISKSRKSYPRRGTGREDGDNGLVFQTSPPGLLQASPQSPSCEESPV